MKVNYSADLRRTETALRTIAANTEKTPAEVQRVTLEALADEVGIIADALDNDTEEA